MAMVMKDCCNPNEEKTPSRLGKILNRLVFALIACTMVIGIFISCFQSHSPQTLIDQSIAVYGGKLFESVRIDFDFRERHYSSTRNGGSYTYTRAFNDTSGQVLDVLNNEGLIRFINGDTARITEERRQAYTNSFNSVIYFALLPYGLNDAAVHKSYVGERKIKGKKYDEIKITFDQEGGGPDHEDEFLYWIEKETKQLDYLAYTYLSDGGGVRFREAVRPRIIEGIRFQDYINYKPADSKTPLNEMLALYENGTLSKLSEINLENVEVKPIE
jgi:hypothetical protein